MRIRFVGGPLDGQTRSVGGFTHRYLDRRDDGTVSEYVIASPPGVDGPKIYRYSGRLLGSAKLPLGV